MSHVHQWSLCLLRTTKSYLSKCSHENLEKSDLFACIGKVMIISRILQKIRQKLSESVLFENGNNCRYSNQNIMYGNSFSNKLHVVWINLRNTSSRL